MEVAILWSLSLINLTYSTEENVKASFTVNVAIMLQFEMKKAQIDRSWRVTTLERMDDVLLCGRVKNIAIDSDPDPVRQTNSLPKVVHTDSPPPHC